MRAHRCWSGPSGWSRSTPPRGPTSEVLPSATWKFWSGSWFSSCQARLIIILPKVFDLYGKQATWHHGREAALRPISARTSCMSRRMAALWVARSDMECSSLSVSECQCTTAAHSARPSAIMTWRMNSRRPLPVQPKGQWWRWRRSGRAAGGCWRCAG